MDRSKVALVRCESYESEKVLKAINDGLEKLGGIGKFVKPGERIVLKPNVLLGTNFERGITTHPEIVKAVAIPLIAYGVEVLYGDSPAFGGTPNSLKGAGLRKIADDLGLKMADFSYGRAVSHKDTLLIKKFVVARGVLESDGLISLPKLKTHALMRLTGAIKNQFGCIPGFLKSQYHVKLPDPNDFATMLIDLNTLIKPRLYIMDGIIAMEGNGPRSGKLKKLNVLLFSNDPIALDATACRIVNLDPHLVPTNLAGEKARLGTYHPENIEVIGESIDSFFDKHFKVNRTPPASVSGSKIRNFIKNRITERPVIDFAKCDCCGVCVRMCPVEPKAVDWHRGDATRPPVHNYDRCIRCYCCQETCPTGAIHVESTLFSRLSSGI